MQLAGAPSRPARPASCGRQSRPSYVPGSNYHRESLVHLRCSCLLAVTCCLVQQHSFTLAHAPSL
eukprot:856832-Pleurochrysis_carterae.AAC.4